MKNMQRILPTVTLSTVLSGCDMATRPTSRTPKTTVVPVTQSPGAGQTTIALAPELIDAVRHGLETATIRKGHRNYPIGRATFKAGDVNIPIEITGLEYKAFQDLSENDARLDGDVTVDVLKASLKTYYPSIQDSDEITIVHFKVLE